MPFLQRPNNIELYYEVHGKGIPLLLSHGYSSTSAMWTGQIKPFSAQYQLIIWDMRGHGQSSYPEDPSQYSEAHTVEDMLAILDHVAPKTQAIVGGLSLGGYMSLAFYRPYSFRVAKLLIIDTGPGFKKDSAREAWNKTANETAVDFETSGLAKLVNSSPERSQVTHRNAKGLALAARGMLAQSNDMVINSLSDIKVPSLIVVGSEDKPFLAATEYMVKKIPGASKAVIDGAGHAANIDRPEQFNREVLEFLNVSSARSKL